MKSEKAEKYLSENGLGYPYTGYVTEEAAERTAEIAEQEAEERMREKAIEAFKETCFHRDKDWCSISMCKTEDGEYDSGKCCTEHCKDCYALKEFIQKLNEE